MPQALLIAAIVVLILTNALFVAAEFALVTARRTRMEQLASQGNRLARQVLRFMDDPNLFISAAQVGITMASLGLGWLGEPALAALFRRLFSQLPEQWHRLASHTAAFVLAFGLITLLHIVFGEQVPKMIAIQRAEGTVLLTAGLMRLVSFIFRPVIFVIYWMTELTLRPFGLRYESERHLVYSVEELEMLMETSAERGELESSERELIHRVLLFSDLTVYQIMVPRTEMVAIPVTIGLPELVRIIAREGRSRYPVYEGTLDQIIGILHVKDLFAAMRDGCLPEQIDLRRLLRQPLTVPESLPVGELLRSMQSRRIHVAIVIDEFGGTAGLVTLEDIVERLIGEIQDEFERPEPDVEVLPNGDVLINGLMLIDEVNERFGLDIDDPNFDTVGGYVFGRLGRKPEIGDAVTVDGYIFRVEALDGLRISRVRLTRLHEAESPPAGAAAPDE
jgi:CBS domain containing-hemolysin-like protein